MATAEIFRQQAEAIWRAGVEAVLPRQAVPKAFAHAEADSPLARLTEYPRIVVVGGGKAGAAMSAAVEDQFDRLGIDWNRVTGWVNVPDTTVRPLRAIHLHPARPVGINEPTAAAMEGTRRILELAAEAGPDDLMLCLLSGGGSALLPAPVEGVSLADKQRITAILQDCGATIQEMNAVRKHISRIKGGGLAQAFRGKHLVSLIISDVIGDSLDVIASGPTCVDPSTFADAVAVLKKYGVEEQTPTTIRSYLARGVAGEAPETLKEWPRDEQGRPRVFNHVIANNRDALAAAAEQARRLGFRVLNLGPCIDGETRPVAETLAAIASGQPVRTCILSGGETTVTLAECHGLGGRNQEFTLAFLHKLGVEGMKRKTILCGGTDGEDGPTDAAGAFADSQVALEASQRRLDPGQFLDRHDAYHFFEPLGALFKTGLTHTNVMDLRVILLTH